MLDLGCGATALPVLTRRGGGSPTPKPTPTPAPISAVGANGWQATMPSPIDLAFSPVSVTRAGYDSAGAVHNYADTLATTKRVAVPFFVGMDTANPTLTADTVALSDTVYADDAITGVTNTSTVVSPKPVANWALGHREVVGDTLVQEVVAFHRNGIACVILSATDGTTTVTQTKALPEVSPLASDQNAVIAYRFALDISTLANPATITVNAKVYPKVGVAASVRDSADGVNLWDFTPRTYYRSTARAAAPYFVYVDPATGTDTTAAAVSTTAATAAAAPVATVGYALQRAVAVLGAGGCEGLRVRLVEATHTLNIPFYTAATNIGAIVYEPAPGAAKANTILSFGTANGGIRSSYIRFEGLTLRRGGVYYLSNYTAAGIATGVTATDCTLDFNGYTASGFVNLTTGGGFSMIGGTITGAAGSVLAGTTNQTLRLLRGVSCVSATAISAEMIAVLGCAFERVSNGNGANRDQSGNIIAFNRFAKLTGDFTWTKGNGSSLIDGLAVVQNVLETIVSTNVRLTGLSPDTATANTRHAIAWHNSFTGRVNAGRNNWFYDETIGTYRSHTLMSAVGNLHTQLNTKHDAYVGANGGGSPNPGDAPNHVGGWSYLYGVGCRCEYSRDAVQGDASLFSQRFPGQGSLIANGDPLFTDYRATTTPDGGTTFTAGAGGGTYSLQSGSPAKNIVTASPLPFGLTGTARGSNSNAGAYA